MGHISHVSAFLCLEDLLHQAFQFYCPMIFLGVSHESLKEGREATKYLWSTERTRSKPEHPRFEEEITNDLENPLNIS